MAYTKFSSIVSLLFKIKSFDDPLDSKTHERHPLRPQEGVKVIWDRRFHYLDISRKSRYVPGFLDISRYFDIQKNLENLDNQNLSRSQMNEYKTHISVYWLQLDTKKSFSTIGRMLDNALLASKRNGEFLNW